MIDRTMKDDRLCSGTTVYTVRLDECRIQFNLLYINI